MEYIYIVFYTKEHPHDYDDDYYDYYDEIRNRVSKIFKTEEKAIKYCESLGKKHEEYDWYESYQEEYDLMNELVEYRYEYYIKKYPITE